MAVLAVRAPMNPQQQRYFSSGRVASRPGQQPVDLGTVLTVKTHFFGLSEIQLSHERVVLMRDLTERVAFDRIDFVVFQVATGDTDSE